MPTRNGLVTPTELKDEALKKMGVEGLIHPKTGLMLPICKETAEIMAKEIVDGLHTPDRPAAKT